MTGEDLFVLDGVVHGFDFVVTEASTDRYKRLVVEAAFKQQRDMVPDPYRLERSEYFRQYSADALESLLFYESRTDLICYHPIPAWGIFGDLSPATIGLELRDRHPDRVIVYGAVSPFDVDLAKRELRRQVEELGVESVKLYPVDMIDGELRGLDMSSQEYMYPFYETCVDLGIKVVAVHKSLPVGLGPTGPFRPDDVDAPAARFPELNFELVHGGFAFLEETVFQLERFENVFVNLEVTATLMLKHPWKFATILGELITFGRAENIVWGSGAAAVHPEPLITGFLNFEMPAELTERYGYADLSDEVKRGIFAENGARMHGIDLTSARARISTDVVSTERAQGLREPWAGLESI